LVYSVGNDQLKLSHLAEEARAMADGMSDLGARQTLISIAETYDAMAKCAERKALNIPKPANET
jgi:hypothetical protein